MYLNLNLPFRLIGEVDERVSRGSRKSVDAENLAIRLKPASFKENSQIIAQKASAPFFMADFL
jgi:hypothetical protein